MDLAGEDEARLKVYLIRPNALRAHSRGASAFLLRSPQPYSVH